jgi:A/G-specific adenine glycosylase
MAEYNGEMPADYETLVRLPGIGPYTAAAILSIGFNQPLPVVDANVLRVVARLIDIDTPIRQTASRRRAEQFVQSLLPHDRARDFNQAIMEFGALVCTPKNPGCTQCPVQQYCRAYRIDAVAQRPVPGKKATVLPINMACAVIRHQGRFFIQQRLPDDVWPGLWEFPGGQIKEGEEPIMTAAREVYEETELRVKNLEFLKIVSHSYTRYRVTLHSYICTVVDHGFRVRLHAATNYRWVLPEHLLDYAFPAGHRQLLPLLLERMEKNSA